MAIFYSLSYYNLSVCLKDPMFLGTNKCGIWQKKMFSPLERSLPKHVTISRVVNIKSEYEISFNAMLVGRNFLIAPVYLRISKPWQGGILSLCDALLALQDR